MKTRLLSSNQTGWVLAISLLPVLGFWYVWNRYAINIPFWDDVFVVENSLIPIRESQSLGEKLRYWFGWYTQTEHRIVYNRLVFWLIYSLEGTINFRSAMVVGNLSLVGMAVFFYRLFQKLQLPSRYFLPVPFLLFGLASYANQFWGMGSLSNFTVLFFTLASLFFLVKPTWPGFALGIFFALAATLTLGSGLLVWAVGLLVLFFQRRYAPLTGWAILTALTIIIYLRGYVRPDWSPDPLKNALNPVNVLKAFAGFAGSTFDVLQPRQATFTGYELFGIEYTFSWIPLLAGGLLAGFAIYQLLIRLVWPTFLVLTGKISESVASGPFLVLAGLLMFVMITALAAALSRAGGDLSAVLNSKYKINSILLTIGCYALVLLVLEKNPREWAFRAFLLFAVSWHLAGYAQYLPNVLNTRQALLADAINFRRNGSWLFYPVGIVTELANRHTARVEKAGFYQFPALTVVDSVAARSEGLPLNVGMRNRLGYVQLSELTLPPPVDARLGSFVVLKNQDQRYFFPTTPRLAGWRVALTGRNFTKGFLTRILTQNLPAGAMTGSSYQLQRYDLATKRTVELNQNLTITP
ncbi:MAG: hypothetical protein LH606_09945 [Cytophagaceae bacterium]|nr:hypothetical protein [Cytophagaceae bacterium]